MKSILMTTSAVLLVTGLAAGHAHAACPEDLDAFTREYEETLQNAAAGEALSTSEQAQLFGLRTAAENLYQAGNAEMCAEVIKRAKLTLDSAIAPQVIRPDELVGRDVVNAQDESLGEIEDVMIDPMSGRIAYVVIEHGGFIGIGQDHFAVPWRAMQFVPGSEDTLLLDIPEDRLENAPRFSSDDETPLERREWVTSVHNYYGVEPYWQDDVGAMALQYGGIGAAPASSDGAQPQADTAGEAPATEAQTGSEGQGAGAAPVPETEPQTEAAPESQSSMQPQTGTSALVVPQPQTEPPQSEASSVEMSTLTARVDDLEQQVQELSEKDIGAEARDSIAALEQKVQTLSDQASGDEVKQSISRLEEQVQQLSQGSGEDIQGQIARLEERVAALGDGSGASEQGTDASGQPGAPAAVVVVPDQSSQGSEPQAGQSGQTGQSGETGQSGQTGQSGEAGAAGQQGGQASGDQESVSKDTTTSSPQPASETATSAQPASETATSSGQSCEAQIAQLDEDLKRAEESGVAVKDARSEADEAQAMLRNNSEALCRAAIKRANEELIAQGFEPTQSN